MSTQEDESKRLRIRDAALSDGLSRRDRDPAFGVPSVAGQTKALSSYPASARRFFACAPITVLGPEVEGGPGTVTVGTSTFFALNLGTAIPPVGTNILATSVDSRWVFRFDG